MATSDVLQQGRVWQELAAGCLAGSIGALGSPRVKQRGQRARASVRTCNKGRLSWHLPLATEVEWRESLCRPTQKKQVWRRGSLIPKLSPSLHRFSLSTCKPCYFLHSTELTGSSELRSSDEVTSQRQGVAGQPCLGPAMYGGILEEDAGRAGQDRGEDEQGQHRATSDLGWPGNPAPNSASLPRLM